MDNEPKQVLADSQKRAPVDDMLNASLPPANRSLHHSLPKHRENSLVKRAKHCPEVSNRLEKLVTHLPIFNRLDTASERFIVPSSVRAIALDFDGTTVDLQVSEGVRQLAWRRAIDHVASQIVGTKLRKDQIEECHRPALHKTEKEMSAIIADQLSSITQSWVSPDQMWDEWVKAQQHVLNRRRHSVQSSVVTGTVRLLEEAGRRGIPASNVTMGSDQLVQPMLERAGIQPLLNPNGHVFINLHPEIRGKPHPDPYLLACRKLNVAPHELLVLEDSSTGALAGFRAGAHVLLQPSVNRAKTLVDIRDALIKEDRQLLSSRPGAITLLTRGLGWAQVAFPE